MNSVVADALSITYRFLAAFCEGKECEMLEQNLIQIAGTDEIVFTGQLMLFGSYHEVQRVLARINEKESIRKTKGVYYTPSDVVRFIVANSIKSSLGLLSPDNIQVIDLDPTIAECYCMQKTVFEPTCGAGEFLLEAFEKKLDLWKQTHQEISETDLQKMMSTIFGNDINEDSVIITKLRLYLCSVYNCGIKACFCLPEILNRNFTTNDYVARKTDTQCHYDIIVGNPPYVEDNKSGLELEERYGNIYANVLENAARQLSRGGSMGFIIPISYGSTPRMKKIRDRLLEIVEEQYILSYADRPDCLFDSVHQKLIILICKNTDDDVAVYTGNYQYWYQDEREQLFANTKVVRNTFMRDDCIPKLGTPTDVSVFQKIMNPEYPTVFSVSRSGDKSIYVNRREAFWIKAFRREIIHPEFKVFSYSSEEEADYCYCLVNSSLFWWYWISVSDCWHVSRELNGFCAPVDVDLAKCSELANALDKRLEETKEYVGTKQTDYEYKHRACLEEIHAIDDFINRSFGLTEDESEYIKSFALRYRISGGALESEGD